MSNKLKEVTAPDVKEKKKAHVADMFDGISPKYDFMNRFLTFGLDRRWRKKTVKALKKLQPKKILDVATGTGDLALECLKLNPDEIIGTDISEKMMVVGREKIRQKNAENTIDLIWADTENLPFEDNFFDAVVVAFGVRNFENLEKGLSEMLRVLKPGGAAVILECSKVKNKAIAFLHNIYFRRITPFLGKLLAGNKAAYTYLPESVKDFPSGEAFTLKLDNIGFKNTTCTPLTFGACSVYRGFK